MAEAEMQSGGEEDRETVEERDCNHAEASGPAEHSEACTPDGTSEAEDVLPYGPPEALEKSRHTRHSPKARSKPTIRRAMAKEGESIYKSHSAYNLITQLQLGIEWSVSFAQRNASGREVSDDDFSKGSPWRQRKVPFYSKGSKQTPKHTAPSFLWKDYYPVVFYRLRQHFEVDSIGYLSSICSSNTLRYLGKPGNSGSSFFISGDDKFIIKIMRKNEVRLLQAILPYYQAHVRNNPDTLLTKFYGLYRIKFSSGKKIRFVVMGNLLTSELSYQRKFDLKGSTYERSTPKHLHPRRHILKDLDMHYTFRLESGTTEKLMMQLEADCAMLERMRIIDYSLLLGVHIRSAKTDEAGDEHAEVQAVAHHRWSLNDVGQSSQSDLSVDREADSSDVSSSEASEADFNGDEAENHTEEKSMNGSITNQSDNVSEQSLGQMALVRPRRDYHGRPIPGSEGSTDSLARAAGHHKILFGQNLAATAAPAENGIAGMGFGKRGKPLPMHDDAEDEMPREEDVIVSFGIVDILQEYSFAKWFEHGFRQGFRGQRNISAVDPKTYASRFKEFLSKIFE